MYFGLFTNLSMFYVKICLKQSYLKRSIQANDLDDPSRINEILQESAKNLVSMNLKTLDWKL
jgi:hypothetical protein